MALTESQSRQRPWKTVLSRDHGGPTAIARTTLSRPVALALDDGLIPPGSSFFDYGCGRGGDIRRLALSGYDARGWDPVHFTGGMCGPAHVVNLGYVINVIEDPVERAEALRRAWGFTMTTLIVSARGDWEAPRVAGHPHGDGVLTSKGTFQRFFRQEELRAWIDAVLGVRSVAAAPGIFYVFRHETTFHVFLASRVRHRPPAVRRARVSESVYEVNREILDPLIAFVESRGRAPDIAELPEVAAVSDRFRSVKAALSIVRRVTGDDIWQAARTTATEDLVVYLALAAFGGRPKYSELPLDLQLDVKAFFGSYRKACSVADSELYRAGDQDAVDRACRQSSVGKLTPAALYVHTSALTRIVPLLRIYEGCGRALTGTVKDADIIKLNRIEPKISYLIYPGFDRDPHPGLATSVRADLRRLDVRIRDYQTWESPPILHRKETFVAPDYPWRDKFARLTAQEERHGLLNDPTAIGTCGNWSALLESRGFRIRGHRLAKK